MRIQTNKLYAKQVMLMACAAPTQLIQTGIIQPPVFESRVAQLKLIGGLKTTFPAVETPVNNSPLSNKPMAIEKHTRTGSINRRVVKKRRGSSKTDDRRKKDAKTRPSINLVSGSQMNQCLLSTVGNWSFNVFNLDKLTNGRSLFHISIHIMQEHNLLQHFNLDILKLMRCISLIENSYHDSNPYHNAMHAADVAQAMHCFLTEPKLLRHLTPLEKLVAILSAITHDVDHPGVNQAYLIATMNPLASLYNQISVLENHHWRVAVGFLSESGAFDHFDQDTWKSMIWQIKSLILATDITRQREFLQELKTHNDNGTMDLTIPEHRHFIMQIALKCADICNPCRPWEISRRWSQAVCEEFFLQGDQERKLELPVTSLCDRHGTTVAKIQTGFMQFVVRPLFEQWYRFCDTQQSRLLLEHVDLNKKRWDEEILAATLVTSSDDEEIISTPKTSVDQQPRIRPTTSTKSQCITPAPTPVCTPAVGTLVEEAIFPNIQQTNSLTIVNTNSSVKSMDHSNLDGTDEVVEDTMVAGDRLSPLDEEWTDDSAGNTHVESDDSSDFDDDDANDLLVSRMRRANEIDIGSPVPRTNRGGGVGGGGGGGGNQMFSRRRHSMPTQVVARHCPRRCNSTTSRRHSLPHDDLGDDVSANVHSGVVPFDVLCDKLTAVLEQLTTAAAVAAVANAAGGATGTLVSLSTCTEGLQIAKFRHESDKQLDAHGMSVIPRGTPPLSASLSLSLSETLSSSVSSSAFDRYSCLDGHGVGKRSSSRASLNAFFPKVSDQLVADKKTSSSSGTDITGFRYALKMPHSQTG